VDAVNTFKIVTPFKTPN